jgi:bisanhydrobacterioruberin hydratase
MTFCIPVKIKRKNKFSRQMSESPVQTNYWSKLFSLLNTYKHIIAVGVMVILYSVGIHAFITGNTSVISLTPINLLISFLLIIATSDFINTRFFTWITVAWIIGFGVEVLGVQTGFPFGEYSYGNVLGYKFWDTPLMIGINWVMLLLASRSLISVLNINATLINSALGATLMVMLDYLIEPIAIRFDFWTWPGNEIPDSNYISWWIIAFLLHTFQDKFIPKFSNHTATALLIIQFLFFGVLFVFL